MMEQRILAAVARADLAVCAVLRWAGLALLLAAVLLIAILAARHLARAEPPMIDYDGPCDITSEGPEGDYAPAFYDGEE